MSRPAVASLLFCFVFLLVTSVAAQTSEPAISAPSDPLEPVTGTAKVLDTPADRSLVLGLMERARQNSALHQPGIPPFTIKLSFTASGPSRYTGSGNLEETFIEFGKGRWTAHLGSYSQLRIFSGNGAFDQVAVPIPMRVATVRTAIFGPMPGNWSNSLIRFAGGKWRGRDVTCALISRYNDGSNAAGRRWSESEFCIDPRSGLLQMASEAPGVYANYDYRDGVTFHGRTLPREITVVEAGNTVLQLHVDSLMDAGTPAEALFAPSPQMLALGPRPTLLQVRFPDMAAAPAGHSGAISPVIVHAMIGPDGKVEEAERIENGEAILGQAALDHVLRTTYPPMDSADSPREREAFINVGFSSAPQ